MSEHILWETIKEQKEKNADLEKENRLLGERCNQLLKDKGDLTDQIADIKANCDFAIEGRDIKIKELEQKLEQTEKDLADYQFNYPKIKELEQTNNKLLDVINNQDVKIADLEQQIEKMKEEHKQSELGLVISNSSARAELEKENVELKEQIKQIEKVSDYNADQRTKAKKIIKTFLQLRNGKVLDCCKDKECPCENPLCEIINEQAEQFLKEIKENE